MSFPELAIAFLLVLGPLIFIHELGHFLAAKRGGIQVLEFGMGYPPRMFRFFRGKGSLSINSAKVIIPRNFDLPKDLESGHTVRAVVTRVNDELILKSIVKWEQDQAASIEPLGMADQTLYGEIGDIMPGTEYTWNWLPLGGFARMLGEEGLSGKGSFGDAPKRWRAITLLAGPGANLIAAIVILVAAFAIGGPDPDGLPRVLIGGVAPNSPAEQVGLQARDEILAVDNNPLTKANYLQEYVGAHRGQSITLSIMRGSEKLDISITPRTVAETPQGQGAMGVSLDYIMATKPYPIGEAFTMSFAQITGSIEQIVMLPSRLIQGSISATEARPVGPVGISQLAYNQIQLSLDTKQPFWILSFMAMISVALGVTNLLPLPALDGGRLIFVLIEAVRRKRISPEREAIVHLIGMALLLALMALITIQDISNPIIHN